MCYEKLDLLFLDEIVKKLKQNKIGIFPCDTIYGIIGLLNETALEKIYELKKRPKNNPFLVLIPNITFLDKLTEDWSKNFDLPANHWPGPVTFIFKKNQQVPNLLTANKPTIGIRLPQFEPLNYILNQLNAPLISTSVNFAKETPIQSLSTLSSAMYDYLDFICFEITPCLMKESAIIDISDSDMKIIRGSI